MVRFLRGVWKLFIGLILFGLAMVQIVAAGYLVVFLVGTFALPLVGSWMDYRIHDAVSECHAEGRDHRGYECKPWFIFGDEQTRREQIALQPRPKTPEEMAAERSSWRPR